MCFQPQAKIQNLVDLVHLLFPWPSLTPVLSEWKLGQEERIRERHPSSAAGCNILHRTWQIMKKLKAFLKVKYLYLEFLTVVGQSWCSSRLKFRCSSSKMLLLFLHIPQATHLPNWKKSPPCPWRNFCTWYFYCNVCLSAKKFSLFLDQKLGLFNRKGLFLSPDWKISDLSSSMFTDIC